MNYFKVLNKEDPQVAEAIMFELSRQQNQLEMIASENFTSIPILLAQGSVLTNKYAEGYPDKRYYGGCQFVDVVEKLAIERACKLFDCKYANVQPHSGSQANQAVFFSLLNPGDTILGMKLDAGGHLTHGAKINLSGKWFNAIGYGVSKKTKLIDINEIHHLAHKHKPKIIIAGGSAYSRIINFSAFRKIADEINAYLLVDMAHFAGLVAGGVFPNPVNHAHIVTSTTHKTLRGPRGGFIISQDIEIGKKINSSVFPGLQGGPLMHIIAAKAIAFQECLSKNFKNYAKQVVANAKTLAKTLQENNISVISGGTDSHIVLIDLSDLELSGKEAEESLEQAGITSNKNAIPDDPLPPTKTSGIRLGSAACTTRGLKEKEFEQLGLYIAKLLKNKSKKDSNNLKEEILTQVKKLCKKFPLYPEFENLKT